MRKLKFLLRSKARGDLCLGSISNTPRTRHWDRWAGGQSRGRLGAGAARLDKAFRSAYNQPAPRRSERRHDGNSRQIGGGAVPTRSIEVWSFTGRAPVSHTV